MKKKEARTAIVRAIDVNIPKTASSEGRVSARLTSLLGGLRYRSSSLYVSQRSFLAMDASKNVTSQPKNWPLVPARSGKLKMLRSVYTTIFVVVCLACRGKCCRGQRFGGGDKGPATIDLIFVDVVVVVVDVKQTAVCPTLKHRLSRLPTSKRTRRSFILLALSRDHCGKRHQSITICFKSLAGVLAAATNHRRCCRRS